MTIMTLLKSIFMMRAHNIAYIAQIQSTHFVSKIQKAGSKIFHKGRQRCSYPYKLNFTGLRQVRAVDTLRSCIRMPVIANACHLMDRKRLSSAAECGVDAVTVTLPPDVAGRCDVSTTNRCSHSHNQLTVLNGTNPYTQLVALL